MLSTKKVSHNEYRGKKCTACGDTLNLIHLGHSYRTDIVKISFNGIAEMRDRDTAISVLFAMLEGISMTYEIERNDIGGLIYSVNPTKPYDLILYDTVSGGAGHVKRLKDDKSLLSVLKNALRKVSQDCCAEDTSCYNCLRTYNNQRLHNHIKRGLAKAALTTIIKNIHEKNLHFTISSPSLGYSKDILKTIIDYGLVDDEETKEIMRSLFDEIDRQKASLPSGFGYTLTADKDGVIEYADFAWAEKNILLFTLNNIKSYENLVNSQSKYKCYLLTSSFDYVKFVSEVND